ncbi:sugar ABC transporter substrate-binding protein [Bifidobacterium sp. ESL0763]|uniref:sugar ABC transporter substrate-binding protein n=1 Tax=Bifidobacterium sp. ESL0763 TaxID=2983227 RepID=UPI0023F84A30|nr:sugar ABC transporter substrate-binding protein [Bifidobacterium sp. ESL0763]MDF7664095.1 sugar ABC transporter substrate-binding protein [Bifidobacterium sp. ESL0763]
MALALSLAPALGSCAPRGAAVGDTATAANHVPHDSVDRSDILVGVVSAGDGDLDRRVLSALNGKGTKAVYAAGTDGVVSADPSQAVADMARRPVTLLLVAGLDMRGGTADAWLRALRQARGAGIPVVLLDPVNAPGDTGLYAEALHVVPDGGGHARSLDMALRLAIDDNPHARTMNVTLP